MKKNISLLWQFIVRDIVTRYKGTIIGFGWVFITPLLLLAVFTLVFNGVFNMKWPHTEWDSPLGFAVFTFCGIILHQALSDILTRSPSHIYSQPNLVTKVVFPLWILPASLLGSTSFQLAISFGLFLVIMAIVNQAHLSWLALPIIVAPFIVGLLGLSLILSSLGVYLRDMAQLMSFVVVLFMFLSPIFYPLSAVPGDMQFWLSLNPMAAIMETTRNALILGQWPSLKYIILSWMVAVSFLLVGVFSFKKLERGFTDVL